MDPRRRGLQAPDDAEIEQLVREVASGWSMPPVRLDAPTWRDRVRSPRVRRMAAARGLLGRVGQAATAAVALTVVGAMVAIVLTSPRQGPGKSPDPSGGTSGSPAPSRPVSPSLLPKLYLEGDLPSPSKLLVQAEGDWSLVDLEKGAIGNPITGASYGSALRVLADGSLACLCFTEADRVNGAGTTIDVRFERYDGGGLRTDVTPIEVFEGAPDPRDATPSTFDYPPHVRVAVSFSEDGRYGFVGWSSRAHPVWKRGLVVVDATDGTVVSRLDLGDLGTGDGERRTVVDAPRVVGATSAGEILVATSVADWPSSNMQTTSPRFDNDVVRLALDAGRLSNPVGVPNTLDCGEAVLRGGGFEGGGVWLACSGMGGNLLTLRRIAGDGGLLNDVTASRGGAISGDTTAMSADGRSIFAWDPITAQLARIDVATGEKTLGRAAAAAGRADDGPLAAFGSWLAPVAAAKSFLQSAVVVSPDGSRVYALGVTNGASERDMSGSSGVFVFDAATLDPVGQWAPTADFVSLALSPDGRFAYVTGTPGVDAAGGVLRNQAASITVFDTATGQPRLIAGQLGRLMLLFPGTVLD